MRAFNGLASHSGSGEESRVLDAVSLEGMAWRRRCVRETHLFAGICHQVNLLRRTLFDDRSHLFLDETCLLVGYEVRDVEHRRWHTTYQR